MVFEKNMKYSSFDRNAFVPVVPKMFVFALLFTFKQVPQCIAANEKAEIVSLLDLIVAFFIEKKSISSRMLLMEIEY